MLTILLKIILKFLDYKTKQLEYNIQKEKSHATKLLLVLVALLIIAKLLNI